MADAKPESEQKATVSLVPIAIRTIQAIASFVVGFGVLFATTGYMIVFISLSKITSIVDYNLAPGQFLAAGAIPWIASAIITYLLFILFAWNAEKVRLTSRVNARLHLFLNNASIKGAKEALAEAESQNDEILKETANKDLKAAYARQTTLADETLKTLGTSIGEQKLLPEDIGRFTEYVQQIIDKKEDRHTTVTAVTFGLLFLAIGVILSLAYGYFLYEGVTPVLGGGAPARVILTFKDEVTPSAMGVIMDPRYHNRSVVMLVHAHLTDGIVARDAPEGRMITVKNEFIASMLDETRSKQPAVVTPAAVGTTVTPEPLETYLPPTLAPTSTPTLEAYAAAVATYDVHQTATVLALPPVPDNYDETVEAIRGLLPYPTHTLEPQQAAQATYEAYQTATALVLSSTPQNYDATVEALLALLLQQGATATATPSLTPSHTPTPVTPARDPRNTFGGITETPGTP